MKHKSQWRLIRSLDRNVHEIWRCEENERRRKRSGRMREES